MAQLHSKNHGGGKQVSRVEQQQLLAENSSNVPHVQAFSVGRLPVIPRREHPDSATSASMALLCIFGVIRAWTGYLMNTEILAVLMIVANVVGAPVGMFALDLWVDSLPSQVHTVVGLDGGGHFHPSRMPHVGSTQPMS